MYSLYKLKSITEAACWNFFFCKNSDTQAKHSSVHLCSQLWKTEAESQQVRGQKDHIESLDHNEPPGKIGSKQQQT